MIVEVASGVDAVRIDRTALARYAFANILIACVLNLLESTLEVHSDPSGPVPDAAYRTVTILQADQSFAREIGNPTTGLAAIAPIPVSAFFT